VRLALRLRDAWRFVLTARHVVGQQPYFTPLEAVARTNAQRLLVASLIRFRPAALIFRFGF
jgi:hypothetical protein